MVSIAALRLGETLLVLCSQSQFNSAYYYDLLEWFVAKYLLTVRRQFHVSAGRCVVSQIETHGGLPADKRSRLR